MVKVKEQIYEQMLDFIAVQCKIEALLVVLQILQENFEHVNKEQHSVISVIIWQIQMIYQEYKTAMDDIEKILLDKNNITKNMGEEHEQENICE